MKSVMTEESTTKVRAFPKLMQRHFPIRQGDVIVLMYNNNGEGTVVYSHCTSLPVGTYKKWFALCDYKDFQGTLTLSND